MSANGENGNGRVRRYGLIGHPLGHSLSPLIHERIMDAAGIRGTYELLDVTPEALDTLVPRLLDNLDGFNVTIPFKEKVIPYLQDLHSSAARYGAVNTVSRKKGYNTDGTGFLACGVPLAGRRVLLVGAGGASRTMGFEAALAGAASIRILSPGIEKARRLAADISRGTGLEDVSVIEGGLTRAGHADTLLNGSPAGMWPHVRGVPVTREIAARTSFVFDSVYNPPATRLLLYARSGGARVQSGLRMLFEQALAAQRIWNPGPAWDDPEVRARLAGIPVGLSRELLRQNTVKYLLTGFMGSGKSTVGRIAAEKIGIPFVDLDDRIRSAAGKSIPDLFSQDGESAFRRIETRVLEETLREPGSALVATGGGTLLQDASMATVEDAPALVILLDTRLESILRRVGRKTGRPLLDGDARDKADLLYSQRMPEYLARADLVIDNTGPNDAVDTARELIAALGCGEEGEQT